MILSFAYCSVSACPVRKEPFHVSEQVNQLLYGERVEVLEVNEREWARIRGEWDGYEGWCKVSQLCTTTRKSYCKEPKYLTTGPHDKILFDNGHMWLPAGSEINSTKNLKTFTGNTGKFKGKKTAKKELELSHEYLKDAALQYLNAPYLWGGRTIGGIDCSGLTQMAYKFCGMALQRDASQQAEGGETVDFLQHAQCGDLAFFENDEGRITHVGMLLSNHTIIHATETSGMVVIDKIDQGGIISTSLRKRTHTLRFVKRYMND